MRDMITRITQAADDAARASERWADVGRAADDAARAMLDRNTGTAGNTPATTPAPGALKERALTYCIQAAWTIEAAARRIRHAAQIRLMA